MLLDKDLTANKTAVDKALGTFFTEMQVKFAGIDPVMTELLSAVSAQIMRSGKRIRPFLISQAYRLAGGEDHDLATRLGVVFELLHQFFMVHDDIVDRDEKRYGGDSLHISYEKKFALDYGVHNPHLGISLGMMGGDLLHTLVYTALEELPVSLQLKDRLRNLINETIYRTMAGWQMHFFQNQQKLSAVTPELYLKGMGLVSAKYTFETPLLAGLMLADGEKWQKALSAYGYHAGMAFQMQDDILGMFGRADTTGKPVGNDYREGKKTLLVLLSYQFSNTEQKMYLSKTLGTSITQIQLTQIQTLMQSTGALDRVRQTALEETVLAKEALEDTPGAHTMSVIMLKNLADYVVTREA